MQDGRSAIRSFASYQRPEDFARQLEDHLHRILRVRLDEERAKAALASRIEQREASVAERERLKEDAGAAVAAVAAEATTAEREATVETALARLADGDAADAKAILSDIVDRKAAESAAAASEAAAAARHLGTLAMLDDTLEALRAFRRASDLDPSEAWTWIHISRLERQKGDIEAAAAAARRARQAAEQAGDDRDVAVADSEFGNVLVAQGNLAEALTSYRAALAIAERLAEADPGNAGWQRDLCVSLWKLGWAEEAAGNPTAARDWYRKAIAIIAPLAELDPTNARWQQDLAWLEERLRATEEALGTGR